MPLSKTLYQIAREILDHYRDRTSGPPYLLYVYEPRDELAVRSEMRDLVAHLNAKGADVTLVSLADLFWHAVDESGFFDQVVQAEKESDGDDWALAAVHETLREILVAPPSSLADRVIEAVDGEPEGCAVVLYRAGCLYPVFRTSALLDDLRDRLKQPVLLFYPGSVDEPYGLKFMGRCEPIHGYRAKIFQRKSA